MATYIYTINIIPYYNSHTNCYNKILTINHQPKGPLINLIKPVNPPKLSPFQVKTCDDNDDRCDVM